MRKREYLSGLNWARVQWILSILSYICFFVCNSVSSMWKTNKFLLSILISVHFFDLFNQIIRMQNYQVEWTLMCEGLFTHLAQIIIRYLIERECEHDKKKTTQQHRVQLENLFLSVVRFFFSCLPVLSCWCETSNASLLWHWWYLQWTFYSLYVILLDILPRFCQTSRHILSDIITENMK